LACVGGVAGCFNGTSASHLAQAFSIFLSMLTSRPAGFVLTLRTMGALDHVDLELLAALSADPRATVVALAERLGLSRNTVQARMARLEKAGVFLSYERAISSASLGFPIEAFISVIVRQADLPRIAIELARVPEVVQAHGLSGQVDLLVRVACRDTQHLFDTDARILAIEGVERTETSLVMGEVIAHRVTPLMELARREP
jgi:DNA-binding Lrp family transcriptional regulator